MSRTKYINFAFCALLAACLLSCASNKEIVSVYKGVDYTEDNAVADEIERIDALGDDMCVKALWRASVLSMNVSENPLVKDELAKQFARVVAAYESKLEGDDADYLGALRLYDSLEACGYDGLDGLAMDHDALLSKVMGGVSLLERNSDSGGDNIKLSSLIDGTVTVYVDKGMRVEHGMGVKDATLGSGFFISADGYVITNHHVISECVDPTYEGYTRLYIKLAKDPDTKIPARVVGYDSILDLALLKAEIDSPYVFELGSSNDLDVGDKIYVIGSPLGLDKTLTSGIISATDRDLFKMGRVFQIDAAVNSGNSGGPMVDEKGRVQAVVFAGVANYQGLNFAIPVEYLHYELPFLFAGGERHHAWCGAYGKTKKESGYAAKEEGLEVLYAMPGSGADVAGICEGDVVVAVNDMPVSSLENIQRLFMQMQADCIVRVTTVTADGTRKDRLVYLDKRPSYPGYEMYRHDLIESSMYPLIGIRMVPVSSSSRRKYVVSKVMRGSNAEETGFEVDDPVEIQRVVISDDKSAAIVILYVRKKSNGYLESTIALQVSLDSLYYF